MYELLAVIFGVAVVSRFNDIWSKTILSTQRIVEYGISSNTTFGRCDVSSNTMFGQNFVKN